MSEPKPKSVPCAWGSVVLVCRQCRRRGSGPRKLENKEVVEALRREFKGAVARPRVILSNCLGLCPKRAMTVAFVGAPGTAALWAVAGLDEAKALGRGLAEQHGQAMPSAGRPAATPNAPTTSSSSSRAGS